MIYQEEEEEEDDEAVIAPNRIRQISVHESVGGHLDHASSSRNCDDVQDLRILDSMDTESFGITDESSFAGTIDFSQGVHIIEESDLEMIFSCGEETNAVETEDSSRDESRNNMDTDYEVNDRKLSAVPSLGHDHKSLTGKDILVLEALHTSKRCESAGDSLKHDIGEICHHVDDVARLDSCSMKVDALKTFNNLLSPVEMDVVAGFTEDDMIEPLEMDILDGRGAVVRENPGNVRMREIVLEHVQEYRDAPSRDKAPVVKTAVTEVECGGVRFWTLVEAKTKSKKAQHRLATEQEVYDRVWHCFRSIITKQNRDVANGWNDSSPRRKKQQSKPSSTARLNCRPIKVESAKVDEPLSFAIPSRSDTEQGAVRIGGDELEDGSSDTESPTVASSVNEIVQAELVLTPVESEQQVVVATSIKNGCWRRKELWIGLVIGVALTIFGIFMAIFASSRSAGYADYDDEYFDDGNMTDEWIDVIPAPTPLNASGIPVFPPPSTVPPTSSQFDPSSSPTPHPEPSERYIALSSLLAGYFDDDNTFPTTELQKRTMEWLADEDQFSTTSESTAMIVMERYIAFLLHENWAVDSPRRSELSGRHVCEWGTFLCNLNDSITGLRLSDLPRPASVPTEIGLLRHLNELEIHHGNVEGSLPTSIGLCSNLRTISLHNCNLSGPIPSEFGTLTRLSVFNLCSNGIQGSVPSQLGALARLKEIELSRNDITGTLPAEVLVLPSLTHLGLKYNSITGTISSRIGGMTALQYLDFYWNRLSGAIPSEIGVLSKLTLLDLYNNVLTGTLPTELGLLTNLVRIDLEENALTGTLPFEIGRMVSLEYLYLVNNILTGTIPNQFTDLTSLVNIQMDGMKLRGTLPARLGNMTSLKWLSLAGNLLRGTIPATISALHALNYLNLGENRISGDLPTEFGKLVSLEGLQLQETAVKGTLPTEFSTMASLKMWNLYKTEVGGTIPTQYGLLTNLNLLDLRQTQITGVVPHELRTMSSLVVWRDRDR